MKVIFHGDEFLERFEFSRPPDGEYTARGTAEPQDDEPFQEFDFDWPIQIRDGTMYARSFNIITQAENVSSQSSV